MTEENTTPIEDTTTETEVPQEAVQGDDNAEVSGDEVSTGEVSEEAQEDAGEDEAEDDQKEQSESEGSMIQ